MAQASITVTGQTIGTVTAAFSITDQEATRILTFAVQAHGIKASPGDANPDPALSMQEVARIAMHDLLQKVIRHEEKAVIRAARASITPINATPVED